MPRQDECQMIKQYVAELGLYTWQVFQKNPTSRIILAVMVQNSKSQDQDSC